MHGAVVVWFLIAPAGPSVSSYGYVLFIVCLCACGAGTGLGGEVAERPQRGARVVQRQPRGVGGVRSRWGRRLSMQVNPIRTFFRVWGICGGLHVPMGSYLRGAVLRQGAGAVGGRAGELAARAAGAM